MNNLEVRVALDRASEIFFPGEILEGQYAVDALDASQIEAVEVSVVWYTEGTGDEDLAVHHFERISLDEGHVFDLRRPIRFSTRLPNSPLSYDGIIVKIRWCVRVRVFLPRNKEWVSERLFRLGLVPDPQAVLS